LIKWLGKNVIFKKGLLLPKKIAQYFVGRQMSTQFVLQKLYEVCSFLSEMYHITILRLQIILWQLQTVKAIASTSQSKKQWSLHARKATTPLP